MRAAGPGECSKKTLPEASTSAETGVNTDKRTKLEYQLLVLRKDANNYK